MDTRLQPREARAGLVQEIHGQAVPKNFGSNQASSTTPTPKTEPIAVVQKIDPNLPPPLTQNKQSLNSELLRRFDAFRTFVFSKHGVVLEIRSGYRSYEEQAQLFRTLPPGRANPPGKSNHEKGEAIDYTNYTPQYNQYLGMFGLKAPFAGKEDWHVERVEVNSYN